MIIFTLLRVNFHFKFLLQKSEILKESEILKRVKIVIFFLFFKK